MKTTSVILLVLIAFFATLTPNTVSAQGAPASQVRLSKATKIEINLDQQTLTATGPEGQWTCRISSGKAGSETPTGSFNIASKESLHTLQKVRATQGRTVRMPHWMFFHGGYAIHGVHPDAPKSYPSSGGCVRVVSPGDAEYLFSITPVGTPVKITGNAANYLAANAVMPWQRPGVQNLLVPDGAGGWKFKRPTAMTIEEKQILGQLLVINEIRWIRATNAMVQKDGRWQSDRLCNFQGVPEIGTSYNEKSYDYWRGRLLSWSELVEAGIIDPRRQRIKQ